MKQTESSPSPFLIPDKTRPRFLPVFQKGVYIVVETGTPLKTLFSERWGFSDETVEVRVGSVFLNNRPVDDLEAARIDDGDVLALSSPMPGLVGAVMRRGGKVAAFRNDISYRPETAIQAGRRGMIRLKLFNALIGDLAPGFLCRGVYITPADYQFIMETAPPEAAAEEALIPVRMDTLPAGRDSVS